MNKLYKKIILSLLILIIGGSIFSLFALKTPKAEAALCKHGTALSGVFYEDSGSAPCPSGTVPATAAEQKTFNAPQQDNLCSSVATCITALVYYPTVGLGNYFAYIGAYVFSFSVKLALNSTAYAFDYISAGWQLARDIANMSFLFILIYIAFTIMLKAEMPNTMKTLAGVIVVALLVNFSFFFTRLVIDTGNILAVQFYNAIDGGTIGNTGSATGAAAPTVATTLGAGSAKDLTYSIMQALQVQTLLSNNSFKIYQDKVEKASNSAMTTIITLSTLYLGIGIILFVLAGLFLHAAAKFMIRMVALGFLIVASPLAFVAAVFTPIKSVSGMFSKWLSMLIRFTFYPAAYLFMFWVLTIFMKEMAITSNLFDAILASGQSAASTTAIGSILANIMVRLGFVVAMMYIALSAADKLMNEVSGVAGWFQRGVLSGAAGGFIGGLGRGTLGTLGRAGVGYQRFRGRQGDETERQFQSRVNNSLWAGMSKRTYDPRNAPALGSVLRGATEPFGAVTSKLPGTSIDFGRATEAEKWEDRRKRIVAREASAKKKTEPSTDTGALEGVVEDKPGKKPPVVDADFTEVPSKQLLEDARIKALEHKLSGVQVPLNMEGAKEGIVIQAGSAVPQVEQKPTDQKALPDTRSAIAREASDGTHEVIDLKANSRPGGQDSHALDLSSSAKIQEVQENIQEELRRSVKELRVAGSIASAARADGVIEMGDLKNAVKSIRRSNAEEKKGFYKSLADHSSRASGNSQPLVDLRPNLQVSNQPTDPEPPTTQPPAAPGAVQPPAPEEENEFKKAA